MKKCCILLMALCLLAGCTPLLEREYSTVEPHSSKFWESEAAGTLRAENYQDIVNDLLLLIGQHTETATLRLYNVDSKLQAADLLERATVEVQQETPMGAYAVEYITSSSQAQRGYYEAELQISYRRTLEQIQAVVNATSPEALYALLDTALSEGRTELAVRLGYWSPENGQTQVEEALARVREERGLLEDLPDKLKAHVAGALLSRRRPGRADRVFAGPRGASGGDGAGGRSGGAGGGAGRGASGGICGK